MKPSRILITGANGLLGTPTVAAFRAECHADVVGYGHHELNVTDAAHIQSRLAAFLPDLVINCAAYTRVDDCEAEEALANKVNGEGAGHVARAAAHCRARLIHLSTDYVFDGDATTPYTEDHPPGHPGALSAYGRSKLLGERLVQQGHPRAIIVRSAWLFGPRGPCFPRSILDQVHKGRSLHVVNDQFGSPTYAPDLARALVQLAHQDATGIFHVTNAGQCSWHEFAREILRLGRIDAAIQPVNSNAVPRPARRPAFSVLDNSRYEKATGAPLRPWRDALAEYMSTSPVPPPGTGAP